jgi:hypothetical protein
VTFVLTTIKYFAIVKVINNFFYNQLAQWLHPALGLSDVHIAREIRRTRRTRQRDLFPQPATLVRLRG